MKAETTQTGQRTFHEEIKIQTQRKEMSRGQGMCLLNVEA